jgi:hypothetical protein
MDRKEIKMAKMASAGILFVPLLFLLFLTCSPIVSADDILLQWGMNYIGGGVTLPHVVPARVKITSDSFTAVTFVDDLSLAMIENRSNISFWGDDFNEATLPFPKPAVDFAYSTLRDMSNVNDILPNNLVSVAIRNYDAFAMNQFGEVFWWGRPFPDEPSPHNTPISLPTNLIQTLDRAADTRFRSIQCLKDLCVLHGMSGRFYASSRFDDSFSIPSNASENPYQFFHQLDLSVMDIKVPITKWNLAEDRLILVNDTQIWNIGATYYGPISSPESLELDPIDSPIKFVAQTKTTGLLITEDFTCMLWLSTDSGSERKYSIEELLYAQFEVNNQLIQLSGSFSAYWLLFDNGEVWYTSVQGFRNLEPMRKRYGDSSSSFLEMEHKRDVPQTFFVTASYVPYPVAMETVIKIWMDKSFPAVPSTHKITSLSTNAAALGVMAVAKPRSSSFASIKVPLVDEVTTTTTQQARRILTWGPSSPLSGTGKHWSMIYQDLNYDSQAPEFASMAHLDPNFRNITKIDVGGGAAIALTSNGTVLVWGCQTGESPSPCWHITPLQPLYTELFPYENVPLMHGLNIPLPLNTSFFGNQTVVDVAMGETISAALATNGELYVWYYMDAAEATKKRRNDVVSMFGIDFEVNDDAKVNGFQNERKRRLDVPELLQNWNTARVIPYPIPEGNWTHISAFADAIFGTGTSGGIVIMNPSQYIYSVFHVEYEIVTYNAGNIDDPALLALIRNPATGRLDLFVSSPLLDFNSSLCQQNDGMGQCNISSLVPFPLEEIRQVFISNGYQCMMILSDHGLHAMGYGSCTDYATVNSFQPAFYTGVPAGNTIKQIAESREGLMLLTNNGEIYLTEGDFTVSSAGDYATFAKANLDFFVHDLPLRIPKYDFPRIVIASELPLSSSPNSQPSIDEISTIALGSDVTCSFGLPQCDYASTLPVEFDREHPVNSPTATQISIGLVGSVIDGELIASGPAAGYARRLRWGAYMEAYGLATSRFQQITYMEEPFYFNATAYHEQGAKMVKTVSVGTTHVTVYSNCSLSVQFYSSLGPLGDSSSAGRSSWPSQGSLSSPVDMEGIPSYSRRAFSQFYPTDHFQLSNYFNQNGCAASTGGSSHVVKDLQCSLVQEDQYPTRNGQAIHCLILTSDSSLYSFGIDIDNDPPCWSGLFGSQNECYSNSSDGFVGLIKINNVSIESALYHKQVIQYQLGYYHVVALTQDGSVVSWGNNDWSQLGLGDESSLVPQERKREIIYPLGTPTQVAIDYKLDGRIRKVVASGFASFLLNTDSIVLGWGGNYFGELGRGISQPNLDQSYHPERVKIPFLPIRDMACSVASCYVLYEHGGIYSWGSNIDHLLGRSIDTTFDSVPRIADRLKFNDPSKRILELITAPTQTSILLRGKRSPAPPAPECVGSAPGSEFECINNMWTFVGDVHVGRTEGGGGGTTPGIIKITGPTKIIGNLTVLPGETLTFTINDPEIFKNPDVPLISVTGCFHNGGNIAYDIEPRAWIKIKNEANKKTLVAVESGCKMLPDGAKQIHAVNAPKDCRRSSASGSGTDRSNARFGLQSTFTIDSRSCTKWWMILLAVIAAAVIIILIVVVIHRVKSAKSSSSDRQRVRNGSIMTAK